MSLDVKFGIKNIPNTTVPTYTMYYPENKENSHDVFFVYITKIFSEGGEAVVKPLAIKNKESLIQANTISQNNVIAGIEKRVDGLYMLVHAGKYITNGCSLSVDFGDKLTSVGSIKEIVPYSDKNYESFTRAYTAYYQTAANVLRQLSENEAPKQSTDNRTQLKASESKCCTIL